MGANVLCACVCALAHVIKREKKHKKTKINASEKTKSIIVLLGNSFIKKKEPASLVHH